MITSSPKKTGLREPGPKSHPVAMRPTQAQTIAEAIALHLEAGNVEAAHACLDLAWTLHLSSLRSVDEMTAREILDTPVAQLGLDVRTTNKLEEMGILRLRELLACRSETLAEQSNVGAKTVAEIREVARTWVGRYQAAVQREMQGV